MSLYSHEIPSKFSETAIWRPGSGDHRLYPVHFVLSILDRMPGRLTQQLHKLVKARSISRVDGGLWYPLRRLSATAKWRCSPFISDTEQRAVPIARGGTGALHKSTSGHTADSRLLPINHQSQTNCMTVTRIFRGRGAVFSRGKGCTVVYVGTRIQK